MGTASAVEKGASRIFGLGASGFRSLPRESKIVFAALCVGSAGKEFGEPEGEESLAGATFCAAVPTATWILRALGLVCSAVIPSLRTEELRVPDEVGAGEKETQQMLSESDRDCATGRSLVDCTVAVNGAGEGCELRGSQADNCGLVG